MFLYIERTGRRRPIRSIAKSWRTACRLAGLDGVTPHDLRKTFGTRVLNARGNLRAAQIVLGHADLATTMRYLGVTEDNIRDDMEAAAIDLPATQRQRKPI